MDDRVTLVERRLEELAREIIETISEAEVAGQPGIRTELKDFTISMLNDGLEAIEPVAQEPVVDREAPFNPLGMAIPVVFAAGVLLLLFPPVGIMLFGVALVMIVWGLIASLVRR